MSIVLTICNTNKNLIRITNSLQTQFKVSRFVSIRFVSCAWRKRHKCLSSLSCRLENHCNMSTNSPEQNMYIYIYVYISEESALRGKANKCAPIHLCHSGILVDAYICALARKWHLASAPALYVDTLTPQFLKLYIRTYLNMYIRNLHANKCMTLMRARLQTAKKIGTTKRQNQHFREHATQVIKAPWRTIKPSGEDTFRVRPRRW